MSTTTPTPPDAAAPMPPATASGLKRVKPALVLALLALILLGWQWYDTRNQLGDLRQELAKRLAESDIRSRESRSIAGRTEEALRQAEAKLTLLETRLAESQNQQVALEALYQELSRNRDESAVAEVEQMLLIASQQLQLAGNVKGALIALQNADQRLQRMDRPQLAGLRKVIIRDIEKLKAAPFVDTVGLAAKLDNLAAAVDTLPLAMDTRPGETKPAAPRKAAEENAWIRAGRDIWEDVKQLVRIQDTQKPEVPLLAPSQAYFLRENLRLRMLSARLALLARDQGSYKADLRAARDWINRYYDARSKPAAAALATLRQLHDSEISIELPAISASLDAVRNYRLSREKVTR
ncbi:MAG: uroporphyrinogen-III C-methyltransferase [Betaproteobacteria bacterium]|nr:uroporphyrinogen-III C-methyltransferase [Betaproteobacteria bacterium]